MKYYVWLFMLAISKFAAAESTNDIDRWIERLGSEKFKERTEAIDQLRKAGVPAIEKLRKAISTATNAEVKSASVQLVMDIERDAIRMARDKNYKVYEGEYKTKRKEFGDGKTDGWVVIVDGRLVTIDFAGDLLPAKSMAEADELANTVSPNALHRFIFKIDDSGDKEYEIGATEKPNTLGNGFIDSIGMESIAFHRDGRVIVNGKKNIGVKGPDLDMRPYSQPKMSAPLHDDGEECLFLVSTGCRGNGMMSSELGERLRLARWEIPGKLILKGIMRSGECHRAYVRLRIQQADVDLALPFGVWITPEK